MLRVKLSVVYASLLAAVSLVVAGCSSAPIDKTAGTITLDHGPIPEAKWPAMTMAFKAAPAITDAATVGEKVDFDVTLTGSAGEVTAIHKQP